METIEQGRELQQRFRVNTISTMSKPNAEIHAGAVHIAALIERLGRLLASEAHAGGMLPVHWEALRYLTRANRFSRNAAALTAYLGLTKGTVSQTVKTLESRNLVVKKADAKDLRRIQLSVTAKGLRCLGSDPLLETVEAIEQLPMKERQGLGIALQSLLSNQLASRDRRPFGQCRDCLYFASSHPLGNPHYCQLLQEELAEADSQAICFEQQARD